MWNYQMPLKFTRIQENSKIFNFQKEATNNLHIIPIIILKKWS